MIDGPYNVKKGRNEISFNKRIYSSFALRFCVPLFKAPQIFSKIKSLNLKSKKGNSSTCPEPITNLVQAESASTLLIGQTSFSVKKAKGPSVFETKGGGDYSCHEKITVSATKKLVLKTTVISNCNQEDKKLARKIEERLVLDQKRLVYSLKDSRKEKGLQCVYSID